MNRLLSRVASVAAVAWIATDARGQDPAIEKFIGATDKRIASHEFLGKLKLIKVVKHAPIIFYLKPPDGEDRQYEAKVVNTYLPFITGVQRVFETHYAGPAGLQRKPEAPAFAFVILHSRGDYLNFAQKIDDPSMHHLRAHYDPTLQLAVTYEDTYAQDTDEARRESKHSILHEFVHALQHAYVRGDVLPAAPWFNEGLADYRANSFHLPSSLDEPPTHPWHMEIMAQVYAGNRLRPLTCSLQEMVTATSYSDVIKTVRSRFDQANVGHLMNVFYAQAEMFTRFLHEADEGRNRANYLRFMKDVQGGQPPAAAFAAVFGQDGKVDFESFEQRFGDWVRAMVAGDPKANASALAGGAGGRLPPSTKFDLARLAWQPADTKLRIAAARRLCADGEYERGLALLPEGSAAAADEHGLLRRERERMQALKDLRAAVVADLVKGRRALPPAAARQGKVLRATEVALVLQASNAELTVGLQIITPKVLLVEGRRLKRIGGEESAQRWVEAWLQWLDHQPVAALAKLMAGEHSRFVDLRADLAETLTTESGSEGHLLLAAQEAGLPDDPAAAANALARFEPLARAGAKRLPAARRTDFEDYVRALAERAFEPGSPAALGVAGLETLPGGRIRSVQEARPGLVPVGFSVSTSQMLTIKGLPNLAYDGPPALRAGDHAFELIGSGVLEWAFPLAGAQIVELDFSAPQNFDGSVILCAQEGTGAIFAQLDGTLTLIDLSAKLRDSPGRSKEIYADQRYRLRIEHDGKKNVRVWIDGKETAKAEFVGTLTRGRLCLRTHTSTPLLIHRILIEGEPVVADPLALRQRFVEQTLKRLLP